MNAIGFTDRCLPALAVLAVLAALVAVATLSSGCADRGPDATAGSGSEVRYVYDPARYPDEPPEVEPEGGYSSLAALVESRNATPERIRELLDRGMEVDAVGNRGWTPLHWAAANSRDPRVLTTLLEAGADVNRRALQFTPLHIAALVNPNPEIAYVLLEAGADVNARQDTGENPLWMACATAQKNPEIILLLLQAGADPNGKNVIGERPLDFARKNEALQGTAAFEALQLATSGWGWF